MKPLAFLVLITSCVSAFSLSLVVYVAATGEIPFDITPILQMPEPQPAPATTTAKETPPMRASEAAAAEIFAAMQAQAERLAAAEAELADRRVAAEELIRHAGELQARMEQSQARSRELLDLIEAEEEENLRNVAKLVDGTESKAAAQMIGEMTPEAAARIVFYMNPRKASELLGTLIKQNPRKAAFASDVTQRLQRLTDDPALRNTLAANDKDAS